MFFAFCILHFCIFTFYILYFLVFVFLHFCIFAFLHFLFLHFCIFAFLSCHLLHRARKPLSYRSIRPFRQVGTLPECPTSAAAAKFANATAVPIPDFFLLTVLFNSYLTFLKSPMACNRLGCLHKPHKGCRQALSQGQTRGSCDVWHVDASAWSNHSQGFLENNVFQVPTPVVELQKILLVI